MSKRCFFTRATISQRAFTNRYKLQPFITVYVHFDLIINAGGYMREPCIAIESFFSNGKLKVKGGCKMKANTIYTP